MGVKGLLALVRQALRPIPSKSFAKALSAFPLRPVPPRSLGHAALGPERILEGRSRAVGVDASGWLFRGAYALSHQLLENDQINVEHMADYLMLRVNQLRSIGVRPLLVFDGASLPMKSLVITERRTRRLAMEEKATTLLEQGQREEAMVYLKRSTSVTPAMVQAVLKRLCHEDVEFCVAPYEADPQLVHLARLGLINCILSDDSDLMVFGAPRVLFKFNGGSGVLAEQEKILTHLDQIPVSSIPKTWNGSRGQLERRTEEWENFATFPTALMELEDVSIDTNDKASFTLSLLRNSAILAGCDYLPGLPNVGVRRAIALFQLHGTPATVIERLTDGGLTIPNPEGYLALFRAAQASFMHQLVFDPFLNQQIHLNPLLSEQHTVAVSEVVGTPQSSEIASKMFYGEYCSRARKPFANMPDNHRAERNAFHQSVEELSAGLN